MNIDIKRICVPTDFSPEADHALLYAVTFAKTFGGELHLLHVLQDFGAAVSHPDFTGQGVTVGEFLQQQEHDVSHKFNRLSEEPWWRELKITHSYRHGNAPQEIARYARKHSIDLIVMGTRGRTGFKHLLVGSVAERVVRIAPCPVLTVRGTIHEFITDEHSEDLPHEE